MSNSSTAEFAAAPAQRPATQLVLVNWPLWDQPLLAWATVAGAAGLTAAAAIVARAPLAAAIVGGAFAICLWRLWLPVRFEIGPRGVVEVILGRRRRIAWNAIGEYRADSRGIRLSPFADSPLRAALRGVYIHCGSRQAEVLSCMEYYLRAVSRNGE
jgi:hypothetical protein